MKALNVTHFTKTKLVLLQYFHGMNCSKSPPFAIQFAPHLTGHMESLSPFPECVAALKAALATGMCQKWPGPGSEPGFRGLCVFTYLHTHLCFSMRAWSGWPVGGWVTGGQHTSKY